MRTFKVTDCIIQFLLIAVCLASFIKGTSTVLTLSNRNFFIFYFSIGGWQLVSTLVHLFQQQYNKYRVRNIYLILLIFIALFGVVAFFVESVLILFLLTLLYLTPVMAIYYCIVCSIETAAIRDSKDIIIE